MASGPSIIVSEQIAQLIKQTTSDWKSARISWTQIIECNCPALLRFIAADMPDAHSSWENWLAAIKKVCQDEAEHTTNPYWILKNLGCIEDWLSAENLAKDQRQTDTAEKITALWYAGTTNAREIATSLKLSRQYVSRTIKLLDLRK